VEEKRMKKDKNELEKNTVKILTDKRLSAIKSCLEKDHSIDCLFLLYIGKGRWGEAKSFIKDYVGKHIADGTFRLRMIELAMLGLATYENIDNNPNQRRYFITDFGRKTAELLIQFFDGIQKVGM
jgi:hypothetical protein